ERISLGRVRQSVRISRQIVVPAPVFSEGMMRDIAKELEALVKDAAGPIPAGFSVQKQIDLACKNLGYPRGHWRVRAAWYGEAANWRSRAVFDLIDRYNQLVARRERQRIASGPSPASADGPPPQ